MQIIQDCPNCWATITVETWVDGSCAYCGMDYRWTTDDDFINGPYLVIEQ